MRPNRLDLPAVMLVVLVFMVGAYAGGWLSSLLTAPEASEEDAEALRSAVVMPTSFFAGLIACVCVGRANFRTGLRGFGLTGRRLGPDLCWAVLTSLAVLPAVLGLFTVCERVVLETLGPEYIKDHRAIGVLENSGLPEWARALVVASALVLAPLAEECFFRGILQTKLKSMLKSRWLAIAVSASLFGLMHGDQVAAVVPLIVMGVSLGFVYEATGSLAGPILVHAAFNLKSLIWFQLQAAG